ncbi:MAG TPA: ABC transporter permease [Firmicutes bacterium]|nr:ABC transporter permease [Bacillota bacterium]
MWRFILRRLVSMVIALWIVVTVTFFLMHAIPGGPFTSEKKIPESILKNIEARYRLDQPLMVQYWDYLKQVITWDLGPSFKHEGRTVNDIINEGFPVSAALGAVAILLSLMIAVPAGMISALKQNGWQDNLIMFFSIIGIAVPSYVIAAVLMYVIGYKLALLPVALWGTPKHMILPAITLAASPTATIARLMRSSTLEVINQDYVKTAKAKGLSGAAVLYRHVLKNAIIPVVSYLGPLIATVFTGSFVVERLFAIPGLGRDYVYSIYDRDYTTIMGVTIFYALLLLVMNLVVDIAYALLDPRIQYRKGA